MLPSILAELPDAKLPTTTESPLTLVGRLSHQVKEARGQGAPTIKQIQELAEKITQASILVDKRVAELNAERDQLNRFLDNIWRNFEGYVFPMWKIDPELEPYYNELALILQSVSALEKEKWDLSESLREQRLQGIQERLCNLESSIVVDGKFLPSPNSVPSGQAIMAQMMDRCYKKVHRILVEEETASNGKSSSAHFSPGLWAFRGHVHRNAVSHSHAIISKQSTPV